MSKDSLKKNLYSSRFRTKMEKADVPGRNLIDMVFSWSIGDVLNKDLYKGQVKKIPDRFKSTKEYLDSFVVPLIEETHADLLSCITNVSRAPSRQLWSVKKHKSYKAPKNLFYQVLLSNGGSSEYNPLPGDLVVLTDVKPQCISDLNTTAMPFLLAYVRNINASNPSQLFILSSKPIWSSKSLSRQKPTFYMVFLTNMTTNIRIWNGLHPDPKGGNLKMIDKIIQMNGDDIEHCTMCLSEKKHSGNDICFKSFGLNESQEYAVTSCIDSQYCNHENTVKLIWGPPGTGKTKTVGLLLFALRRMKCSTVICAPTNIAVVEVASRLMSLVTKTSEYDTYGFGDIVLFGNKQRMMIDDLENLTDIFLDNRVEILEECFYEWKTRLVSMINFLGDPEAQYLNYSAPLKKTNALTLEEFFKKQFSYFHERLKYCVVNLYTHLPTQFISLGVVKEMMLALELLRSLETLMNSSNFRDEELKEALNYTVKGSEDGQLTNLEITSKNCLKILKSILVSFRVPKCKKIGFRRFCLENASLIFCTASSSCKLSSRRRPLDLLVIDEAAQLKECESTILFQLPGLRHAILVGDERQLPAMIQSQISGEAELGRSLFERLVLLGQKRQLLDTQYRMHPSISSFPNKEFYDGNIMDAPAVKDRNHEKQFLHGSMYGTYSFINLSCGKEQHDHQHSLKNMVEVAVVCQIVASLFKEFTSTKQRISIGVISPYKAQVYAIEEKLEKKYSEHADSGFNVRARSVDGFQGGEEDVIIISTVRCNINGSVGFLTNHQRSNVALTRARHCLWVLGNEATLIKSDSVWKKLVTDAKERDCFYNADDDKDLAQAIITSLLELQQFDTLLSMDSPLFKDARWKINFSNDFWKSMSSLENTVLQKKMLNLLQKLSTGWRHKQNNHSEVGDSSGMLQVYLVNGSSKYLLWSVDIKKECSSHFIQVLKVWDILPLVAIPKFAKRLERMFGEYTLSKMSRCVVQRVEGKLIVPMRWSIGHEDDNLSRSFASLSISDKSSASNAKFNFRHLRQSKGKSYWIQTC